MNLKKIGVYACLVASAAAGTTANEYLSGRPAKRELAKVEQHAKELGDRLGRCYSTASKSYVVNPDMTVTVWDITGDRKVRLSDIQR